MISVKEIVSFVNFLGDRYPSDRKLVVECFRWKKYIRTQGKCAYGVCFDEEEDKSVLLIPQITPKHRKKDLLFHYKVIAHEYSHFLDTSSGLVQDEGNHEECEDRADTFAINAVAEYFKHINTKKIKSLGNLDKNA